MDNMSFWVAGELGEASLFADRSFVGNSLEAISFYLTKIFSHVILKLYIIQNRNYIT